MQQMRNWFISLLAGSMLVNSSCDNELDINGDYIEKAVVWGLLELDLDTNYIRINKTFLDESSNAYLLATDPSNLYFREEDLEVYLEEWNNTSFVKRINVQYVDGDSLGFEKEEGMFANSPNILYRITTQLDTFATYKLFIVNNLNGDTITSQTQLVQPFSTYYPTKSGSYLNYTDTTKITYTCHAAVNGKMYELWMKFYYWQRDSTSGDSILKHVDWQIFNNQLADNIEGMGNVNYSMYRNSLFTFLAGTIENDPGLVRSFSHIDFHWYAGGIELYDQYLNILANLGINEQYISPEYTNIDGGLGIFSSRYQLVVPEVFLSNETLDTIACGSITGALNFASSLSNPFYPGCE